MKTITGIMTRVFSEPDPDKYFFETDRGGFLTLEFKTVEQAVKTPINVRIALSVDGNVVADTQKYYQLLGGSDD